METQYVMDVNSERILPHVDAAAVKSNDSDFILQTYGRLPVTFVKGSGMTLWDTEGNEYLDFLGGIAVNGVGHCHPTVVRAIQEQASTLIHTSNLYYTEPGATLAKKLVSVSDADRVFFCNSGAEANEAAIKIARKYGKSNGRADKFNIVTAVRSFHGRTMATVTATGQPKYREPFEPMIPGFHYVPFNDLDALSQAVNDETCAVLLEPIQGEGGVYPADQEFLDLASSLCKQHDALLIFDEIQTGMGRTGKWWAYQHYGVIPDIMTVAKALGGGVPIGALLARGAAATTLVPGDHGTTFGGNPLATRTALAVIEAMENEHLIENAHAMGAYFTERLRSLGDKLSDIRALGLMVGVDLTEPDAKRVQSEALRRGLIVNAIGDHTLRFLPPLIVKQPDIDRAISILASVV